jgi:hypothetical protein
VIFWVNSFELQEKEEEQAGGGNEAQCNRAEKIE